MLIDIDRAYLQIWASVYVDGFMAIILDHWDDHHNHGVYAWFLTIPITEIVDAQT